MKRKLIIIGIDGMDRDLIAKYIDVLPNFKSFQNTYKNINMVSVFPPDSDTAWASIYTGLNPAKHGVVDFVDPLERKKINLKESEYIDINAIKGKTFWDIAGNFNKKTCIIYPHLAFPVWPVNGFIINPHPETGKFHYFPSDFKFKFKIENLMVEKRIPRTKLEFKKYYKKKIKIVHNEFNFAYNMLKHYEWDLFFFYSSALDSIMHIFWNYCDPNDPTYPGENPFKNVIKDFYVLHDKLIGKLIKIADDNTIIMILSDHGHYMRPVNLFNINEILRQEGLLIGKDGVLAPIHDSKEKFKRLLVDIAQRSGLRPAAQTILRLFPKIKKIYTHPSTIDFNKTIAHCIDLSGMKSYTYGGIVIAKEKLNSEDEYVVVKDRIKNTLLKWKIPGTNENVIEWICDREELYSGEFLNKYPDIIFNLKEGYGAGWAINVPVFTKAMAHKFYPGSHRGSTPIFYLLNIKNKKIKKENVTLMDIAPTVLDLLGIDWRQFNFDGESILS